MRIAVVGAGGVGGYFGARLAAAGNEVTFVARGRQLEAIRRDGLLVRSPLGEFRVHADAVVPTIADLGPVDVLLVAVKLWDTDDVVAQLRNHVGAGTMVISLQNGVQKDAVLRRELPAEAVAGGVCYISAAIAGARDRRAQRRDAETGLRRVRRTGLGPDPGVPRRLSQGRYRCRDQRRHRAGHLGEVRLPGQHLGSDVRGPPTHRRGPRRPPLPRPARRSHGGGRRGRPRRRRPPGSRRSPTTGSPSATAFRRR